MSIQRVLGYVTIILLLVLSTISPALYAQLPDGEHSFDSNGTDADIGTCTYIYYPNGQRTELIGDYYFNIFINRGFSYVRKCSLNNHWIAASSIYNYYGKDHHSCPYTVEVEDRSELSADGIFHYVYYNYCSAYNGSSITYQNLIINFNTGKFNSSILMKSEYGHQYGYDTNICQGSLSGTINILHSSDTGNCPSVDITLELSKENPLPHWGLRCLGVGKDDRYISMPRENKINDCDRLIELKVSGIDTPTLVSNSARLVGEIIGFTDQPIKILDALVSNHPVSVYPPNTLFATITLGGFNSITSPFGTEITDPPKSDSVIYRFRLVQEQGGQEVELARTLQAIRFNALWRAPPFMQEGSRRYGSRDTGGDDWASRPMYQWLNDNFGSGMYSGLVMDDISGEHGKNIKHKEHQNGRDVDLCFFPVDRAWYVGTPPKLKCGENFGVVFSNTQRALAGDAKAKADLKKWVETQRVGLKALVDDPKVKRILFARGKSLPGVPAGWMGSLICEGKIVIADPKLFFDLEIGSFDRCYTGFPATSKLQFAPGHNNHMHVDL
ncbi:MAG: hypothetical protein WAV07_14460 [Candidatus Contendobacter sp.]